MGKRAPVPRGKRTAAKKRLASSSPSLIGPFSPSKSDLRRMALLEGVIQVIADDGYDLVSVQAVAAKTKMLRSHVAYYFPNADAMLEAAIHYVVRTGQEITVAHLASAPTPQAQLEAWVCANFAWFERYPAHRSVMSLLHFLGTRSRKYRELNRQIREAGQARLETILAAGRTKTGLSAKALPRQMSQEIRAFLIGALVQFFSCEHLGDYEQERVRTLAQVRRMAASCWG